MLDDFEPQPVLFGGVGRVLSGVALIDKSQFHVLARYLLNLFGQRAYLVAVSCRGRRYGQRQQMPKRIDRDMYLRSLPPLGPVIARPRTRLRRRLQRVRLSMQTAVGWPLRPAHSRTSERVSSTKDFEATPLSLG
jgi:hypothetical protein